MMQANTGVRFETKDPLLSEQQPDVYAPPACGRADSRQHCGD